jgi:hypothetical protein
MHDTLGHRQRARTEIDHHQQLTLRVEGRPYPMAGTLKALDGCVGADLAIFDVTEYGIQLVELHLAQVDLAEAIP